VSSDAGVGDAVGDVSSGVGVGEAVGVAAVAGAWSEVTVQNSFAGAFPSTPWVLYPIFATVTPGGSPTALQNVCVCPGWMLLTSDATHPSNTDREYAVLAPYVCPSEPMTSTDVSS
jgi:hypothetical protein